MSIEELTEVYNFALMSFANLRNRFEDSITERRKENSNKSPEFIENDEKFISSFIKNYDDDIAEQIEELDKYFKAAVKSLIPPTAPAA